MNNLEIGVYRITCTENNRQYFGSSSQLSKRMKVHRRELIGNRHTNKHLQADWNQYGPGAFEFEVLIRHDLSKHKRLELENIFIHAHWDGQQQCYNIAYDARGASVGHGLSIEARAKISEANRRRTWTPEARAKMAEQMRGNTRLAGHSRTPETRAKQAESLRTHWLRKKAAA